MSETNNKKRWPDKIANEELHRKTSIAHRKYRSVGHIISMDNIRIYTTALTWHPDRRKEKGWSSQNNIEEVN